jgi:hypothetical protein
MKRTHNFYFQFVLRLLPFTFFPGLCFRRRHGRQLDALVKEHLAEKYPNQDMSIVAGSFEIKLARAISERPALAQNHSRGMRI